MYNTPTQEAARIIQDFDRKKEVMTDKDLEELPVTVASSTKRALNPFLKAEVAALLKEKLDHSRLKWPTKVLTAPPGAVTTGVDLIRLKPFAGVNFATQDYMGLSNHPKSKQVAIDAIKKYGTHSGGSPLFFGRHSLYEDAVQAINKAFEPLFKPAYSNIFSTGWLAGHAVCKSNMTSFYSNLEFPNFYFELLLIFRSC